MERTEVLVCCARVAVETTGCSPSDTYAVSKGTSDCDKTTDTLAGTNFTGSIIGLAADDTGKSLFEMYSCLTGITSSSLLGALKCYWYPECDSDVVHFYVYTGVNIASSGRDDSDTGAYLVGYLQTTRDWYLSVPLTIPCAEIGVNWPSATLPEPHHRFYEMLEIPDCAKVNTIQLSTPCPPVPCDPYDCFPVCIANTCGTDPTVNYSLIFWHLECDGSSGEHSGQFDIPTGGSGGTYQAGDWPFTGVPEIECVSGVPTLTFNLFGVDYTESLTLTCDSAGEVSWSKLYVDPAGGGSGGGPGEACTLTLFTNNAGL